MDPILLSIILGVAANGLTSILSSTLKNSGKLLIGKELIEKIKIEELALDPILKEAIEKVSNNLEWMGPSRIEIVCLFICSPDVEAIVRQIYSTQIIENYKSLDLIQEEFLHSFSNYIELNENEIKESSNQLFKSLVDTCQSTFKAAIDKGLLSAHEAQSSLRYRILKDELDSIKENIKLLKNHHKISINEFLEFKKKYRKQVEERHAFIIPPHFDTAHRVPINELYVLPNFSRKHKRSDVENSILNTDFFLSTFYRAVLLGNPGGGKSTFAIKLCHDMSQRYDERLLGNRHVVPVLVILREYAVDKKNHSSSILQHIESICCSKYQIEPPPGAFEFFLRNGHLAIIFDGLDELIDTSFRQEISSDIESFCSLYPNVPALIISREVGYEQAPLDENRFEVFRLTPFTEEQVGEYVKKWFSIDVELLPEQKTQKVKAFINESLIVPDLRSNPLMLALMCNIYRGENYIPRNRPDVYEKCALLLFERLDKSKGIYIQFPFEAHINPAIKYIAHWIYENEDLQDGVAENKLIQKATEYLCNRRFEDIDEATKAAREFIEFCKGRAWVFTDIGTTKEGERLYQFTHRTFLEYFTAAHLVRIYPIPEKLKDILLPKILKREWDVVAQLAIQMQNKNVEGAGDVLLEEIVNFAQDAALYDSINLLFFAGRCLEFMVPSPKITRIITKSTMLTCLKLGLYIYSFDQQKSTYKIESKESAESFLSGILNASIENRPIVTDSIEKFYVDNFNMSGEKETNILFEIGANLDISIHQFYKKQANDLIEYWRGVSEKFTLNFETSILQMSTKNFSACLYLYRRKKSSIDIIIQRFGLSSVFLKKYLLLFPSVFFMSIVESIIISLITGYSFNGPDLSDQLDLLGKIFEENSLPWIRETELGINHYFDMPKFWIYNDQKDLSIQINLSPKGYFAIFGIMAIIYEKAEKRNNQNKFLDYFKRDWININWMFPILHTRRERKWDEKVAKILKNLKFSDINKEIVFNWINRKIKFSD